MGGDGSAITPEVPMEGGGLVAAPHETTGAGGSAALSETWIERGGSVAAPSETREMSPPAREQGAGSKRSRPDELEQGSGGSSPKCSHHPKAPEWVTDSPIFPPPFCFSVLNLCLLPLADSCDGAAL